MHQMKIKFIIVVAALMQISQMYSNVVLPAIFADNMVLQRNADVAIWGWAKPGETVKISSSWDVAEYSVTPNNRGFWKTTILTNEKKGSQELVIEGYNKITLKNILLGEVWLISGQSNMEWSAAAGIENGERAIQNSKNDSIRFFTVNHKTARFPQDDLNGSWVGSKPETMKNFSAVAYFFAQKLNKELQVPVGLIGSTWGGTPAETWVPKHAIERDSILVKAAGLLPETEWGPKEPGSIYNAMIHPLMNFKIAGVLWYQGESNTVNSQYYEKMFTTLIESWRVQFNEIIPFYFAQIAPYKYETEFSGVQIRDAQRRALRLAKTGMVVTSDIGNINDIHPKNKKDVGIRFANLVMADKFKKEIKAYPPLIQKATSDKNKIILNFSNAELLHIDKNNKASQFEIAGADKVFQPVDFKIKDNQIFLKKGKLEHPLFVRYSWANSSIPNIFNGTGLPTSSFTIKIE